MINGSHAEQLPLGADAGAVDKAAAQEAAALEAKLARLREPFKASLVQWRVVATSQGKGDKPDRGQVSAYVSQRAFTDRLNNVLGPSGWTRTVVITTAGPFERGPGKIQSAKIMVVCEVTIHGVGTHAGASEEFADDPNALARADARAFKHACNCFGLGRYLHDIDRPWVELDNKRKPRTLPALPDWAKPAAGRADRGSTDQRTNV